MTTKAELTAKVAWLEQQLEVARKRADRAETLVDRFVEHVVNPPLNAPSSLGQSPPRASTGCGCPMCFVRSGAFRIGSAMARVLDGQTDWERLVADFLSPVGAGQISLVVVTTPKFETMIEPALRAGAR